MEENGQGDTTDARGIFGKYKNQVTCQGSSYASPDAEEYFMSHSKRGKCLIFNNKMFDEHTRLSERRGTDADGARLFCRFRELGFDVSVHNDFSVKQTLAQLDKVSKEDHSDNDCFVCCILTHGDFGILFGRDGKFATDSVFAPFRGDVCPTLAGKPKMFFIQACQGDQLDSGVDIMHAQSYKESADGADNFRIPTHADFLVAYSTVPGFYSWRNTTNGSWFIQALCNSLEKHICDKDILQILTIVNCRVAYDYESYTPQDTSMHLKKQVPCVTSTLTRRIKLLPKI